ncbi:MAG: RNA polymerase factor sigma-54 [Bacteroidaceae bacterium]|nr:RNA polymerase factor sigma-54 [Bacteroidaceae bacterium]
MPQELIQTQTERQVQTAAALQVALARMIELPLTDLRERVENEMMDNAALEERADDGLPDDTPADGATGEDDGGAESDGDEDGELRPEDLGELGRDDELGDYLSEDDVPSYLRERKDTEREQRESPLSYGQSFYEALQDQIGEHDLSDHERTVMDYLIGSLDSDGLLRKPLYTIADELAVYHDVETDEAELERLLSVLQTFEPRGIGARSLQECLALQLADLELRSPYKAAAQEAVAHHFKDFASKHWDTLQRRLHLTDKDFAGVIGLLTHLNPAPGSAYSEEMTGSAPTVVPDFYVSVTDDGELSVSLNDEGLPELRVSPAFRDTVRQYAGRGKQLSREQSDAYVYARQKVESAQNFLNLLTRRNQTLRVVMRVIARRQRDFFLGDDDETLLRPMALKDVAAEAGVDISTVSRVAASKYVQTAYGTYPLKFFFSNEMSTGDGESVSSRKIKLALRQLIDGEDKRNPYSDETLTQLLNEQGFNIARRTVAKYRGQMGLPTGRLRK